MADEAGLESGTAAVSRFIRLFPGRLSHPASAGLPMAKVRISLTETGMVHRLEVFHQPPQHGQTSPRPGSRSRRASRRGESRPRRVDAFDVQIGQHVHRHSRSNASRPRRRARSRAMLSPLRREAGVGMLFTKVTHC